MSDDTIVPSPLLDRDRVAAAIRRGVRLDLHPVTAKAAAHGMPVELTEQQSLQVADAALAALVAAHPIDGRTWLIEANKDWQRRNTDDALRHRALLAGQCAATDRWRATAMNAYAWLFGFAGVWQWHWPRWSYLVVVATGLGAAMGLRRWLLRRDRRKAGAR